jgi:hypothetical protein
LQGEGRSLKEALELPKSVYEVGQRDEVRRLLVFNQLNRAPESGPSRALVTASSTAYGLTEGGTQATHLKLTDSGRRIVEPVNETDRLEAAHEALFSNDIFAGFIDHYMDRPIPQNEVAMDWLATNYQLPEKSARSRLDVITANIKDFGLTQVVSGKTLIASRETAMEGMANPPAAGDVGASEEEAAAAGAPATGNGHQVPTPGEAATIATGASVSAGGSAIPRIHFNVQIHIPENGSPEDYDAIFKSIGTYLLGRKGEQ